tara:strand:+ start:1298 stop:1771 length:474 start_codon:yes stop_codon:yes gene_type:complete
MDYAWVEVADTAIKIGLGAVVAGMSGYVALIKNQSHELEKEHRLRYFDLQEEKKTKYVEFLTQSQMLIQTHIDTIANLESEAYLTYLRSFNEVQILVGDELRKAAHDVSSSVTVFIVWNKRNPDKTIFDQLKLKAQNKIGYFQKLAQLDVTQIYNKT